MLRVVAFSSLRTEMNNQVRIHSHNGIMISKDSCRDGNSVKLKKMIRVFFPLKYITLASTASVATVYPCLLLLWTSHYCKQRTSIPLYVQAILIKPNMCVDPSSLSSSYESEQANAVIQYVQIRFCRFPRVLRL